MKHNRPPNAQAIPGEPSCTPTLVRTVFLHFMQNVVHGLGPRIGTTFVKATNVADGIASKKCYHIGLV